MTVSHSLTVGHRTVDLLPYFERRTRSGEDAADLLDQSVATARQRTDDLSDDADSQRMWLFVAAALTLAQHRRPWWRTENTVRDTVLRLRDAQRELVTLIQGEGLTIVEAAELLGMNPPAARSRYVSARTRLREALIDVEAGMPSVKAPV